MSGCCCWVFVRRDREGRGSVPGYTVRVRRPSTGRARRAPARRGRTPFNRSRICKLLECTIRVRVVTPLICMHTAWRAAASAGLLWCMASRSRDRCEARSVCCLLWQCRPWKPTARPARAKAPATAAKRACAWTRAPAPTTPTSTLRMTATLSRQTACAKMVAITATGPHRYSATSEPTAATVARAARKYNRLRYHSRRA